MDERRVKMKKGVFSEHNMIKVKKYNPKNWLVFNFYSRFVFKRLLPMLIFMIIFTVILEVVVIEISQQHYSGLIGFHSILGIFLGLFLVLRTNTAYDRWWEGRKLWGQLVNDTRNLALKINSFTDNENVRDFFRQMIPNIAVAMKEHLRESDCIEEMEIKDETIKDYIQNSVHKPNQINKLMYSKLRQLKTEGEISDLEYHMADKELKGFTDIIGACERIHSTPIPSSYSMFIKKFIFFYIFTLPVAIVWQFEYWTTLIVLPVYYFLLSLELIAEEIEDPFGKDINDLPLDELSKKIKLNIDEIMSHQLTEKVSVS